MPNSLQLLLSPRPPRTHTASQRVVQGAHFACEAWWDLSSTGQTLAYERHFVSRALKAQGSKAGSDTGPPLHMHLKQKEYFTVLEGEMGVELDGKDHILRPEDGEFAIPVGTIHRFWPHSGGEKTGDMLIRVRVDEYPGGFDQRFLRNCFCYLNDCAKHKLEPSVPQLFLFMWSHGMVIAVAPVPVPILHIIHFILGYVIGQLILGYSTHYPEYYNEDESSKVTEQRKDL